MEPEPITDLLVRKPLAAFGKMPWLIQNRLRRVRARLTPQAAVRAARQSGSVIELLNLVADARAAGERGEGFAATLKAVRSRLPTFRRGTSLETVTLWAWGEGWSRRPVPRFFDFNGRLTPGQRQHTAMLLAAMKEQVKS